VVDEVVRLVIKVKLVHLPVKTVEESLRGGPMGAPGNREAGADPGYVPDGMGGGPG